MTEKRDRWDRHFLQLALDHARMSKDPSTQVGAIVVGPDMELISAGFNGFPRGISDTPERLGDRETKYEIIVHAEMNAILAAARSGVPLRGCTLYVAAIDDRGLIWGGPPCVRCAVEAMQAGITEIVSWPQANVPERWRASLAKSESLLTEAGVRYREAPQAFAYNPDLIAHLRRQRTWSEETFGPRDLRDYRGITKHIRKELDEIEREPHDIEEWIDVAILAFDGAWRAGYSPEQIVDGLFGKASKNRDREWPDWRTRNRDEPTEHIKSGDDE